MKPTALAIAAFVTAMGLGPAFAQQGAAAGWLDIGELATRLAAQGYVLREVERDDGRYEVKLVDADGTRFEADLHRSTGEILKIERDDD